MKPVRGDDDPVKGLAGLAGLAADNFTSARQACCRS